jgi:hypothetical protein
MPDMLRRALPRRPEARRMLVGTLLSAVGRGLTLPFLFIYLTDVRGLIDIRAGLVIGCVIGPVTAGPLIGAADGMVWVAVVVGGCLAASLIALSLRRLLTVDQDGRPTITAPAPAPTPV